MGYTLATIKELSSQGAEIHVVHWDHNKQTNFQLYSIPNVFFYKRSSFNYKKLLELVSSINPVLTIVSGWQDYLYLKICSYLKRNQKKVVVGFDDQWRGTLRQRFAALLSLFGMLRIFFSHAWVAGPLQYEYARRFGFEKNKIIFDLLSADVDIFYNFGEKALLSKVTEYPHRFLFVGRFVESKGLKVLIESWKQLGSGRRDWELHLIGSGSELCDFRSLDGVLVSDFMQPDELAVEIYKAGCFILPSNFEPWGVVVHEFSAAGLPLILSNVVGSSNDFLIHGLNGYSFESDSVHDLIKALKYIISKSDAELITMGNYSRTLSRRITPITSAARLLSMLE